MGSGGRSGEVATSTADASASLLHEEQFTPFLRRDFNHADFASSVLREPSASVSSQTKNLRGAIERLDQAIRSEVCSKQDGLLQHARRLQDSEKSLLRIQSSVDSLKGAVQKLRDGIQDPFQQVSQKSRQLSNLHAVIDSLRLVNHRLKLTAKLQQIMQTEGVIDPMDLAKAAKILRDLETAAAESDLTGIEVLDRDVDFVAASRARVVAQADALLTQGMSMLGQAEVGSALQVFFNLETLKPAVLALLKRYSQEVDQTVRAALDVRQLSGAVASAGGTLRGMTGPGSSGKVQDALWKALDEVANRIHGAAVAIWHLHRVIAKKRDPLTLTVFLDVVKDEGTSNLLDRFWQAVADSLGRAILQAKEQGGLVRDALAHSFPRLFDLLESMFDRIARDTEFQSTACAASAGHRAAVAAAVGAFREAFLSASFARMEQAVNNLYPAGSRSLPSPADVQKCISKIHEEMKSVSSSTQLGTLMAVAVGKAMALMGTRVHMLAASGQDLKAITGAATQPQLRNISLSSQIYDVHRSFLMLLPRLPAPVSQVLREPLEQMQASAIDPVVPIFRAASDAIEATILQMHDVDWAVGANVTVMRTSAYTQKLSQQLAHFRMEYLAKFAPPPSPTVPSFASLLTQRLASRVLTFFVRHAALLRPLTQQGKLQLAKDMAELEQEVRQHLYPPDLLGEPHSMLRAFRALIFLETDAILASHVVSSLPKTTILFHLLSRLPSLVKSPHERAGVSPKQYSQWMDAHGPADILSSIMTAVQATDTSKVDRPTQAVLDVMTRLQGLP